MTESLLSKQEKIIAKAQSSFIDVGEALATIRDKSLFGKGDETFEGYCEHRWEFSRSRAYQLITGAKIARTVLQTGIVDVVNEGQCRELTGIDDPDMLLSIVETAKDENNGRLTAAAIRRVRKKLAAPAADADDDDAQATDAAAGDVDPDDGEDWGAVVRAIRRTLTKTFKELPPQYLGEFAGYCEDTAKKARRKAQSAPRPEEDDA